MVTNSIKSELNRNGNKRGLHPNSLKNLQPGKGRPKKGLSITNLIREMLDQQADYISPGAPPSDKTWRQMIARAMLIESSKGNVPMVRELLERLEGKVTQPISGSPDNEPIIIKVIYDNGNKA